MNNSPQRAAKGFTRAFWVSNTVELFERMAYYAVFIVLTIYLSTILGFNDFDLWTFFRRIVFASYFFWCLC